MTWLIGCFLAVIAIAIVKEIRVRSQQPYILAGSSWHFEGVFTAETVAGFQVRYRLSGVFQCKDKDVFIRKNMFDEANRERLLEDFHRDCFAPFLEATGFFAWGWTNTARRWVPQPHAWRFQGVEQDEKQFYKRDLNCTETKEQAAKLKFQKNGCEVNLVLMTMRDPIAGIGEENADMISPNDLPAIRDDDVYKRADEFTAVIGSKRLLEIRKTLQQLGTEGSWEGWGITITTKQAGEAVQITWERTGQGSERGQWLGE